MPHEGIGKGVCKIKIIVAHLWNDPSMLVLQHSIPFSFNILLELSTVLQKDVGGVERVKSS